MSAEQSKNLLMGNRSHGTNRDVNDSDTEDSQSDSDQSIDFIDESVRHLTVGKIKVSKLSDLEKTA